MASIAELKKDFVKTLNGISYSRQPSNVFSDWLEMAAIALHQLPYRSGDFAPDTAFEQLEEKYLQIEQRYSQEERNALGKMLGITTLAHRTAFGDFLGEIASDQELLNQHAGQFFTPYNICRMMAKMTLSNAHELVEEKGLITFQEPAAGGGALVIACAEELLSQKIDPRSCAQFDCIDVSRNAFNMCYIQMSLYELQAVVRHGNTLSMDMWESRPTPQIRYFDQWLKQQRQTARLEALKGLMMNPATFEAEPDMLRNPANDDEESAIAPETQDEPVQTSLLDMDTFGLSAPKAKQSRRSADIELPADRQLGLFDLQNEAEG
ncbi:MAG: N-6 DNA methylase [Leptolyngbya sp. SIO4C1]|nr:N-6 DNA methylase [Leptolyngbya sp. SIO4C1]